MAYGPFLTKVLARWQGSAEPGTTGYWIQRNADNFAFYALAKYLMGKNGNIYPHLPMVVRTQLTNAPTVLPPPGTLAEFVTDGSDFYLNTTDDSTAFDAEWAIDDYPGCTDDEDSDAISEAGSPIDIDGFAPASAYPDYNSQVSSWISALVTPTPLSTPTSSDITASPDVTASSSLTASTSATLSPSAIAPSPLYSARQCSFHLTETQTCNTVTKNLYAIIHLKYGIGIDIGDTNVNFTDPLRVGINDGAGYPFASFLPYPLVVTGEHEDDYVQFTYGGLSWQSRTPNGGAHCDVGGWDPRDGPICGLRYGNVNAVNNMDCFFPC